MTPNFALSLSFDGIRLMHRVKGGWHLVDEVALDDPDLTAALARLRQTAVALEPSGLRTKILLPNDQIKYLSLDSTQTSIDDVRNALHGTTPYNVDDLIIDFNRSGGRTHIAAVARETLSEAEAFANQHRFAPVTFAAVAEPYTFNTEVFFGMTKDAAQHLGDGITISRDDEPVKVIGRSTMPAPAMPVPAGATDAMPLTVQVEPKPEIEPEIEPDPIVEDEPVLTFSRSNQNSRANQKPAKSPQTPPQSPAPVLPATPSLPEIDEPVFTSRKSGMSPTAPVSKETADPAITQPTLALEEQTAPDPQVAENDAPAPPAPIIAQSSSNKTAPQVTPAVIIQSADAMRTDALRIDTPMPKDEVSKPEAAPQQTKPLSRRKEKAAIASPATVGPLGGSTAAQSRGKPRFLGLILTAGLLAFLALVAVWASTLDEDGIAGLLGMGTDAPSELAASPQVDIPVVVVVPTDGVSVAAEQTPEAMPETPVAPIVTTVPGRVLSPGEADRIYAATGVWQRAPRLPALPTEGSLDGLHSFATVPVVAPVTRPRDLASAAASVDTAFLTPPNPAPAGTVIPRDADGFIVAAATGTVMPNGVLVFAKAPAVKPPARPAPQVATTPDVTDDNPLADSVAAAIAEAVISDVSAPENAVTEDEVADTPDPALETEEPTAGAVRLAGLRPSIRPQGLVPPEPFADQALAGLRPSPRPEGLAPQPEETPQEDVAEVETPEALGNDIASVIAAIAAAAPPSALVNPTTSAIVASPRPDIRPNNFSRVVASAQQNTARQQTTQPTAQQTTQASAPAVASSAAARPSGAIPRSVAAAATMDSVINLRNVNLIGVYGRPNDRRALIRLSNGSYVKVEIGSSLDGGRVTAINDNALNYVVRGKTYALQVPSG